MNVSVNRTELLTLMKRAAMITPTRSPLEILCGVLVETGQASLTITATNLEVSLQQTIPCRGADEDAAVIQARYLHAVLEKLAGDTVHMERHGKEPFLTIRAEQATVKIPILEPLQFPKTEIPFPEDTVTACGIPSMAKRTLFATAQEDSKPILRCVHLIFTENGLKAVGSDGSCLVSAKGDAKSTGNISFLIDATALEKLSGMCRDEDVFRVGTTGKCLVFLRENFLYSVRLAEGTYLNTEQIITSVHPMFSVLTDIRELHAAVASISAVMENGKIGFFFDGLKLTLQAEGEQGRASIPLEVIPLRGSPKGDYWFSIHRLLVSLKALNGTATLSMAREGVMSLSTEDAFYMQTAMRAPTGKKSEHTAKKQAA